MNTPHDWQNLSREALITALMETKKQLADRTSKLEAQLVSGFYEDRYPVYSQGKPQHELQDVITAVEANRLVSQIQTLEQQNAQLREEKKALQHTLKSKWGGGQ